MEKFTGVCNIKHEIHALTTVRYRVNTQTSQTETYNAIYRI